MLRARMFIFTTSVILLFTLWAFAQAPQAKTLQQFHPAKPEASIVGLLVDGVLRIYGLRIEKLHTPKVKRKMEEL